MQKRLYYDTLKKQYGVFLMVYANNFFCGNDNDTIHKAIENRNADGIAVIQPRCYELEP